MSLAPFSMSAAAGSALDQVSKAALTRMALTEAQAHDIRSGREKADDWGLFRECLGGFAACGLLRETIPNHPTVVGLWMHQCFGLSKSHWGLIPRVVVCVN